MKHPTLLLLLASLSFCKADEDWLVSYVLEPFDSLSIFDQPISPLLFSQENHAVVTLVSDPVLHGSHALQLEYQNTGPNHKYVLHSTLQDHSVFACRGARQLSFSYMHKLLDGIDASQNDLTWELTLFDSHDCTQSCHEVENLEAWSYVGHVLTSANDEDDDNNDDGMWQVEQVSLDAPDWYVSASGENGNAVLDLNSLKGWRLELSSSSSTLGGTVWFDQLALQGPGEMIGAAFYADSYGEALNNSLLSPTYYVSNVSEANTSEVIYDGQFYVDYTVQHTQDWGGYVAYDFTIPGRAYYDVSKAETVTMNYHTVRAASTPQRVHLRFIMVDSSHCLDAGEDDCGRNKQGVENYYSFHHVLDHQDEKGVVSVVLQGANDPNSPFYQTLWSGAKGNHQLDKDHIKGFVIEVSLNSLGEKGSFVNGAFELSNLRVIEEHNVTSIDTSSCLVEPSVRFLTGASTAFNRIEFLNFEECCNSCNLDTQCNYAFSNGLHCFKTEILERDSISINTDPYSDHVFFVKKSEDDFCDVCDCRESDLTIDCRGRGLITIPSTFHPGDRDPAIPGPPDWNAKVLDLRNNPGIVMLGRDALASVDFVEEVRFPSSLAHIDHDSLNKLPNLKAVSFSDALNENADSGIKISNAIMDPSDSYSDVCCGRGDAVSLLATSPVKSLTFCDLVPDSPGVDSEFEDFVRYSNAILIEKLTPSSHFMSEAAEDKYKCSEYCNIREDCFYFSYDGRLPNTEHICYLLADQGTSSRVCCERDHHEDEAGTLPGWVSGRVSRTRHKVDNARVILMEAVGLVADEASGYTVSFDVKLGSMPTRGAVWVVPSISDLATGNNDNLQVALSPEKVVLYDNTTTATVKVTISNAVEDGTIVIENMVESCDAAFSMKQSDLTVLVDVVLPEDEEKADKYLWISVGASLGFIVLLVVFFLNYVEYKKRQGDSVWYVDPNDLNFGSPAKVIGSGSFGLVLLAEYRGTEVAVKRVLPPRLRRQGNKSGSWSMKARPMFDNEAIDGEENSAAGDPTTSSWTDVEGGFGFHSQGKAKSGLASAGNGYQNKHWTKAFKYSERADLSKRRAEFIEEMRHLSKLRHPNITTVMGAVINRSQEPLLVMEFMDHGSLHDLLQNNTIELEGEQLLPILRDIAQGVRFLHSANPQVIHGDLKARNILVDSRLRAKVADFGLSEKKRVGSTGTPYWMAPELLTGETTNTTSSDVFSFAVILYEVFSRKNPYEDEEFATVMEKICDPIVKKRPAVPRACPPEMEALMRQCWEEAPEKRPSFKDLDIKFKSLDAIHCDPKKPRTSLRKNNSTETLLNEVFPPHVAAALREGRKVEPQAREVVTIVFSDIVGFTTISASMSPLKVADMLDRLYTKFDALSRKHEVFKVETIGDSWMGVTNLVKDQKEDHVVRIVSFASDAMREAQTTLLDTENPGFGCVNIRIGLHSGPVVANVVGSRSPRYCLFGDTVNTASRMESHSSPGRIHCSDASAALLIEQNPRAKLTSRGRIPVKGKGHMETHWVCDSALQDIPEQAPYSKLIGMKGTSTRDLGLEMISETVMIGESFVEDDAAGAVGPDKTESMSTSSVSIEEKIHDEHHSSADLV